MAEASQYSFELSEVTKALIISQGLHNGIWALGIEFGMGAGNVGSTQEEAFPSAFVQIKKLGLVKADKESMLALDAAKVNPPRKTKK